MLRRGSQGLPVAGSKVHSPPSGKTRSANEPEAHPMRQFIITLRERFVALGGGLRLSTRGATGRMTPAQARRIVVPKGEPMTLDWVTDLSPAAARILARHDGQLRLPALRELSVETARCLARHRGHLSLDGCSTLEPAVAEALARHGLESMRASAAECLAAGESDERFSERDEADLNSAERMADIAARLDHVKGIEELTLSLAGLRKLAPRVARALGSHKGTLVLDGLRELDGEAAAGLKYHFGSLDLNGLRTLSPAAARALAHAGGKWPACLPRMMAIRLRLNGLMSLSAEAARELAAYQGTLWLGRLRELTPSVAAALGEFRPLDPLDRLVLSGLRSLSPEAARNLASFEATLCLDGLTSISPELAEALVEVKGRIHLYGVRSISSEAAAILFSRLDVHLCPGWR